MIFLCVRFLGRMPTINSSLDLTTVSELKNNKNILVSVVASLCSQQIHLVRLSCASHVTIVFFLETFHKIYSTYSYSIDTIIMIFHLHSFFPRILINRNRRQNGMQRFFYYKYTHHTSRMASDTADGNQKSQGQPPGIYRTL